MAEIRFFFDNCAIGPRAIPTIKDALALHPLEIEVAHLMKYFDPATPDEVWTEQLANENWIVITADRGKRSGGEKLPKLCLERHITHVLMSRAVNQFSNFQRITTILENIDDLVKCCEAPRGSRFHLRASSGRALAFLAQVDVVIPQIPKIQKPLEGMDDSKE